jgi:peptide deformylase
VRVLVIDTRSSNSDGSTLLALINPEIVSSSGETVFEEGCLSLPEFFSTVKRYEKVMVRGLDRDGNPVEIDAEGLLAIVLQHEIDHLDGKLFIDRLSPVAKDIFKRKWKKRQQEASA